MVFRWARIAVGAVTLCAAATPAHPPKASPSDVTVVKSGDLVPPPVTTPCAPGRCLFQGQHVRVLCSNSMPIGRPVEELKAEFEAATGASLELVRMPHNELFAHFISDATHHAGRYDAAIAGAWWLGELVQQNYIQPYDKYYRDARFPRWSIEDVLPAPRSLLSYAGHMYMVANDHDGQIMYYRRDLLSDPAHRQAFAARYGYALGVPTTWAEFRDVAEYFHGKDLNGDGTPDSGMVLPLKPGAQSMFHFLSLSASFVIGPANPKLFWFDPHSMKPLIDSPGHLRALTTLVSLAKVGPPEMLQWDLGRAFDHFLSGRAALAFSWGDLGALAQQEGSRVKGRVGAAHVPGTTEYHDVARQRWVSVQGVNRVGNTIGGSWAGVISRQTKAPEATYFLLAMMASRPKSMVYAARGWDGIDPGRSYHFLPPHGSAPLEGYLRAGWNEADVRDYTSAYFENFTNKLQFPYLRIPGTYSYLQALDLHVAEAAAGQLSPQAALSATATDFEEITIRLGRERQRQAYRRSLGL